MLLCWGDREPMRSAATVMPFVPGAMIGATGMYLLDPEHGLQRRTPMRNSGLQPTRGPRARPRQRGASLPTPDTSCNAHPQPCASRSRRSCRCTPRPWRASFETTGSAERDTKGIKWQVLCHIPPAVASPQWHRCPKAIRLLSAVCGPGVHVGLCLGYHGERPARCPCKAGRCGLDHA